MTTPSNSRESPTHNISKFAAANLYGPDFVWKPEPNWTLEDQLYYLKAHKKPKLNFENPPTLPSILKVRDHQTAHFRYLLEDRAAGSGWCEIQLFKSQFSLGIIFSDFEKNRDLKIQKEAFSFLISASFLAHACDYIRFYTQTTAYSGQCPGRQGKIVSFHQEKQQIFPTQIDFREISKQDWMKEGPGKKHEVSLLYLLNNKHEGEKPSRKKDMFAFLKRFRGMRNS